MGKSLRCKGPEKTLEVERRLNERVAREARRLDGSIDSRLPREVDHLQPTIGELVRISQRGPDQVLDPPSTGGLDRARGELAPPQPHPPNPEAGNDERPLSPLDTGST